MTARAFRWVLVSMLLAGASCMASAQDADAPPQEHATETLHVSTRIVEVDVVVTDRKGNPVTRPFTRDDFTVYEDNKPQPIVSFEPPTSHAMPGAASGQAVVHSAADLAKIGDAPVTILVLDELNSRFEDMSYARQMMMKYLEAQPAVLPQPTALLVVGNIKFQQLHDYTQDRDALLGAVKKHVGEFPWRMEGSHSTGPGAVERLAQSLSVLDAIAKSSTGTPGRKNLVWVGNGSPSANTVGLPSDEAATISTALRHAIDRLTAAHVTMFAINPTADSTSMIEANSVEDLDLTDDQVGTDPFGQGQLAFLAIAPATGGIAYAGRNDIDAEIGEGVRKLANYYTIAYRPTNNSTDAAKFRSIHVVMKDKSLRTETRDGYYSMSTADLNPVLDATMKPKQVRANLQMDLSSALTTTLSYNGLAVAAAPIGNGMYAIRVAPSGIEWSAIDAQGKEHAEATVAAAWYNRKGAVISHVAREQTSDRTASGGATYVLPIKVPEEAVRLRIVVRDALNGHMGTVDLTKFN